MLQKVVAAKTGSSSGKHSFTAPAATDVVTLKNFQNCQVITRSKTLKREHFCRKTLNPHCFPTPKLPCSSS
jgi:hypothetical protein